MSGQVARCAAIAFPAVEQAPQHLGAPLGRDDLGPVGPGRIVPHMLVVAAFQLCNPVLQRILMKTDDSFFHTRPGDNLEGWGRLAMHALTRNGMRKLD